MKAGFRVQRKQCKTCIYRADNPLDIKRLEAQVADKYGGFKGFRVCHHGPGRGPNVVCCRGFWNRHKDQFAAGQIAQRLNAVVFVNVDKYETKKTHRTLASGNCGLESGNPKA